MQRFFIVLLFLSFFLMQPFSTWAQKNFKVQSTSRATYPQGDEALYKMMMRWIDYPKEAIEAKAQGIIMVSYTVRPDSSVANIKVVDSLGYGIEPELIKVLKNLQFVPASANGMPVKSTRVDRFQVYAREWKK